MPQIPKMGDPILVTLMKLQPIIVNPAVKIDPIQRQIPISLLLELTRKYPWGPIGVLIRYIYIYICGT